MFFYFFFVLRLFMSILRLQTASLNMKNDGFPMENLTFLRNQVFVYEDWFGRFWGQFLVYFLIFIGFLVLLDGSNGVCRVVFF